MKYSDARFSTRFMSLTMALSVALLSVITLTAAPDAGARLRTKSDPIEPETRAKLVELRSRIRQWSEYCEVRTPSGTIERYMSHGACDNFGDMAIFAGLACLAGEPERCRDVQLSQGPDGRWWRSPNHVGREEKNSFSRDQGLGILAYLVATRDVERARMWQKWIQDHGHGYKLCADSDGRCDMHPGFANLMGDVWKYLGLKPTGWMRVSQVLDPFTKVLEAKAAPLGFQLHLLASHALVRQGMEVRVAFDDNRPRFLEASALKPVTGTIYKRQSSNPLFRYLRFGGDEQAAKLVLEQCPSDRPQPQDLDWAWQRDSKDEVWRRSSGHDCIFMINLLIGSDKMKVDRR